jgi:CRP/FNR family transcriptional regulator, cyclic AMP receptor protein
MREEREVKLLSLIDVFQPLSELELRDLAQRCADILLETGQNFYHREKHDNGLFLIKEGRVRVCTITPTGKQTTLDLLEGGTVLWARSLANVHGHAVQAQALEPTSVAFMNRENLERFVLNNPAVGLRMMDLLAERLASTSERMAEVAHKPVLSRLASQILRLVEEEGVVERGGGYRLPSTFTHEDLGAMIGAKRVAVTRALKKLQAEGGVELSRRRIHVTDARALRRIALQDR